MVKLVEIDLSYCNLQKINLSEYKTLDKHDFMQFLKC